jgi:hypothetical protein
MYLDALICPVIVGNRRIVQSSATSLVNPVLTRAEGFLRIQDNSMLTRVDFPSLSIVRGYLSISSQILARVDLAALTYIGADFYIHGNPSLTFASLPRLSQVQGAMAFCQNAPSFVIPNAASGTAAAPGLTSVGFKGTGNCQLQNGSGACVLVTCP